MAGFPVTRNGSGPHVLLFYPYLKDNDSVFDAPYPWMPMAPLVLAKYLERHGFQVTIVDQRVEPDYQDKYAESVSKSMLCGVSSMTGRQIHYGLEFSRWAKSVKPDIPVCWGGMHPTLFPEETLAHELVDIVAVGQGYRTIVEIATAIKAGDVSPLSNIRGVCFEKDHRVVNTGSMSEVQLEIYKELPLKKLNIEAYLMPGTNRIPIISSAGCPRKCSFCYLGTGLIAMSGEEVYDLIAYYRTIYPEIHGFRFFDPNFMVNNKKVLAFCELIQRNRLDVGWTAFGDLRALRNYTREEMEFVARSGCDVIHIGAESASPRLLAEVLMKAHNERDMVDFAEKCQGLKLDVHVYYMFGVPTETLEDCALSVKQILDLRRIPIQSHCYPAFFMPYPNTKIIPLCESFGWRQPSGLVEWSEFDFTHAETYFKEWPWTKGLYTPEYRAEFYKVFDDSHLGIKRSSVS